MAAGLNFNSIWAGRGYPIDMIQLIQLRKDSTDDFQIAGSDCSGIVYKIGSKVKNVKVVATDRFGEQFIVEKS